MDRPWYRWGTAWLLGIAAAAASSGCGDDALQATVRALGEGCLLDSDCDADLVCVFRRCHVECETTPDCRARGVDTICVLGDRPTHVCLLPDEAPCEAGSDCPGDMACGRDGTCRDLCLADASCLAGQTCLKGSCGDVDGEGLAPDSPLRDESRGAERDTCRYTSQCLTPLACRGGICESECRTDRDCDDDARCTVTVGAEVPDALACLPSGPPGPPHCADAERSGDETDVDCGGSCTPCAAGHVCGGGADCASEVCIDNLCQVPNCSDGVTNGDELATDCGGSCGVGCPTGSPCLVPSDCISPDACEMGICVAPTCADALRNGSESDVDCGGPACPACADGRGCTESADCASSVCHGGTCIPSTCSDLVRNGDETDVDCGGSQCGPCALGAGCQLGSDCATLRCDAGSCAPPSCTDMVQNGAETGIDCGGGCPDGCALGSACTGDGDCSLAGGPAGCLNGVCTAKRVLTINLVGTGIVVSVPPGVVNCGSLCTAELFPGTAMTLHAFTSGSFNGFTGDCVGSPSCTLTVNANDLAVTATFTP